MNISNMVQNGLNVILQWKMPSLANSSWFLPVISLSSSFFSLQLVMVIAHHSKLFHNIYTSSVMLCKSLSMLQVLLVVRNATALQADLVSLSQFSLIVQTYSLTGMDCQTELIGVCIVMCVFYYVYNYCGGWFIGYDGQNEEDTENVLSRTQN
jgi:hypothetical protein